MKTELPAALRSTREGARAEEILRSCVHCGFCNATCPTYQLTGDELDGPRGRIYLIKELLETGAKDVRHEQHLNRCLTCRSCETTCPSGVMYGELAEIARARLQPEAGPWWRPWLVRWLKAVVPSPRRFRLWTALGTLIRPLLPATLAHSVPGRLRAPAPPEVGEHERQVTLLQGCVQRALTPEVNHHVMQLLDRHGVRAELLRDEGCCGSLALHLGDEAQALSTVRANVEALSDVAAAGRTVISSASGCGVTVKEYGRLLPDDPRASVVAERTLDLAEYLDRLDVSFAAAAPYRRVAWHAPCTLQHGQRVTGVVERLLTRAGYELVPVRDAHLCCGSAGTYSILEREMSGQLRSNKIAALTAAAPEVIATANVGCQTHLAGASDVPVVHWVTLLG